MRVGGTSRNPQAGMRWYEIRNLPGTPSIYQLGDYSNLSIDPVDGCTFWYTQEHNNSKGWAWGTKIGSSRSRAASNSHSEYL